MTDVGGALPVTITQGDDMSIDHSFPNTTTTTIPVYHRPPDPSSESIVIMGDRIVETNDPQSVAAAMSTDSFAEINDDIPIEDSIPKDSGNSSVINR